MPCVVCCCLLFVDCALLLVLAVVVDVALHWLVSVVCCGSCVKFVVRCSREVARCCLVLVMFM